MEERGSSGDEGLDRILGGGLPLNGINLIMGLPGSGKTLLCQQFIFAGATEQRPGTRRLAIMDGRRAGGDVDGPGGACDA